MSWAKLYWPKSKIRLQLLRLGHDVYIKRIGFSLIRVHRVHNDTVNVASSDILLANLKWPIEYMCAGLRPSYNTSSENPNQYRDWHRLTKLDDHYIDSSARSSSAVITDPALTATDGVTHSTQTPVDKLTYSASTPTVNLLKIQAHGIDIFGETKVAFFNEYMPFTFGGANILTPQDPGAFLINFCLYPGTYQPSGHINVSRAREFRLWWQSSYIGPATSAELILVASALNFLLISDGSAVLRYST